MMEVISLWQWDFLSMANLFWAADFILRNVEI